VVSLRKEVEITQPLEVNGQMSWEKPFLGPIVATISGLLLPAAGLWGSFYFKKILSGSAEAWFFWVLIALYIVLSSITKIAEKRFQSSLIRKGEELKTAILTMPLEGFMAAYGTAYVEAHKVYRAGEDAESITKDELELLRL